MYLQDVKRDYPHIIMNLLINFINGGAAKTARNGVKVVRPRVDSSRFGIRCPVAPAATGNEAPLAEAHLDQEVVKETVVLLDATESEIQMAPSRITRRWPNV